MPIYLWFIFCFLILTLFYKPYYVNFQVLQSCLQKLSENDFKRFKRILWEFYPECFRDRLDILDIIDLVDKMLEVCDLEVSLKITGAVLNKMKLMKLAEQLKSLCKRSKSLYAVRY